MSGLLKIRRLGYALGAEVTGVDLRSPLEAWAIDEVGQALLDHLVLCFPGQHLERAHMRAFCSRFGELEDAASNSTIHNYDPQNAGVMMRTNKPFLINFAETKSVGSASAANMWHSDHSYIQRPNTITFLSGQELPDIGGDTMFSNMYMAYDALSPAYQRTIEPLAAVHDMALGPAYAGSSPELRAKMSRLNPPVVQPLVWTHAVTGRKALYVGARVRAIQGMTEDESRPLVSFLNAHAVRYEFVYRHRWAVDDLLMWDNRCAMHRAVQDFDQEQTRRMLRCSLVGPQTGTLYARSADSQVRAPEAAGRLQS